MQCCRREGEAAHLTFFVVLLGSNGLNELPCDTFLDCISDAVTENTTRWDPAANSKQRCGVLTPGLLTNQTSGRQT